jgi:hypothetical protein
VLTDTPLSKLPTLEAMLGSQSQRLRGIGSWEQAPSLGKRNQERLVQLTQENIHRLLADGESRDELHRLREGIAYLTECQETTPLKPILPRLRSERIMQGDDVYVYMGDTEGSIAPTEWVKAVITEREKGHNSAWVDSTPNSGYFWRLTATASVPFFPDVYSIPFSTSEPRVLLTHEYDYLKRAVTDDPEFLEVFATNAWRTWSPFWCLERGLACAGEKMDMKAWITTGTAPA